MAPAPGTAAADRAKELSIMDDDKSMLEKRVARLRSGFAWAEDPPSVTVHLIANVDIAGMDEEQGQIEVRSAFFVYRAQLEKEREFIAGHRRDWLVQRDGGWRIRRREVELADGVLAMKNLSIFL
jgi:3-phenylpropionate/cinnamic acid dioxygenase small subunit